MAPIRKNINLFLMDGDASGRLKCSMLNWTGVGYKIPRSYLQQSANITLLKQSGVYFLFGADASGSEAVYIGQAGARKNKQGLLLRVSEPHPTIELWNEAVLFTTTSDALGPTELCYLENKFCNMAIAAKRYVVTNGNEPNPGNITEEKEAEMDEFIEYAAIVIRALGYKVFEPIVPKDEKDQIKNPVLYYKSSKVDAKATITDEGFVILAGSRISEVVAKSCPDIAIKKRSEYKLKIKDFVTTADLIFPSPSCAASFAAGSSTSGNAAWKAEDGTPLKDLK